MKDVERAISILEFKGYRVWRLDYPKKPFPGLYRIDGGPEITEAELISAASQSEAKGMTGVVISTPLAH